MEISAIIGDITHPGTEAIVNAANGIGVMGAGVAGAISKAAGPDTAEDAKRCYEEYYKLHKSAFSPGMFYKTTPGDLRNRGVKCIYHAVTMMYPGSPASIHPMPQMLRNIIKDCVENDIKSISFPGLGTGIGGLDKASVARVMAEVFFQYDHLIDIVVLDRSSEFINAVKGFLEKK